MVMSETLTVRGTVKAMCDRNAEHNEDHYYKGLSLRETLSMNEESG